MHTQWNARRRKKKAAVCPTKMDRMARLIHKNGPKIGQLLRNPLARHRLVSHACDHPAEERPLDNLEWDFVNEKPKA